MVKKISIVKHELISLGVNITQNNFKILLQHFLVYFISDNLKCTVKAILTVINDSLYRKF